MLILDLLSTTGVFFKNSTLNSAVVGIAMCSIRLDWCSLEVTSLVGCSHSFNGGRALDCFNRLFECSIRVFQFFKFSLTGGFLKPLEAPSVRP